MNDEVKKEKDEAVPEAAAEPTKKEKKKQHGELEQLKETLAQTEKKLDELNDRFLRTAAEYDNYRKRTEKEKRASVEYGVMNAVTALLPALDNLERAMAANTADAEFKKGVEMTLNQFVSALNSLGVAEIEALGKPFDPELHSAVSQLAEEGVDSGTVTAVIQKGYQLNGRVVRHTLVAVAP